MRGRVGVVIPCWYSAMTDPVLALRLLRTTLAGSDAWVEPHHILVVIDGSERAAEAAEALRSELSFRVHHLSENQGKAAAVEAGLRTLLADPELDWFAVRDADGDHFLDDLPHLFRAGEQAAEACPGRPILVVGSRSDVHAALGWRRGEFEMLLNEVLVEALAMALAREGRAWDTRFLAGRYPDLQSGYKLYDRAAASLSVAALTEEPARDPSLDLRRVGMELIPFVTAALNKGVMAETLRKSFYDQPVTSYGTVDMAEFYGKKLLWALRRCVLGAEAAMTLLDGAMVRRPLFTDPDARDIALRLRRLVLEGLNASTELVGSEPARRLIL